jgi:hypothetical protein
LLHEIFGFHHLAACINQNNSTFEDFLSIITKFSTISEEFADLLDASEFLKKDCQRVIFGEYGCAMLGFSSIENYSEEMIQLYLVSLDNWKFNIKSNITERQHIATSEKLSEPLFIAEITANSYEVFFSLFNSNFHDAKNVKRREVFAVSNETSHQKTPSFILSVFQTTVER